MKGLYTTLKIYLLLLLIPSVSKAQITVTNADFAAAGDTALVSLANINTVVDLTLNGAAQTWDFSTLVSASQTIDSFISVSNTGLIYSLYFANVSFNSNRASLAQPGPDLNIPNLTVTNVNNFYYAGATQYRQVGIGAELNGIQTPIAFGNKDVIYNFPMNYGNADSSDSDYGLSIPGLGTYQARQKRVNHVDGWGTLITPYGTFNTLRIVSDLSGSDSLYLDTLGFGFTIPRAPTREYKWIGNGQEIPLLQINTQVIGGNDVVTAIRYRDHDSVATAIHSVTSAINDWQVYPNPSVNSPALLKTNNSGSGNVTIRLSSANGVMQQAVLKNAAAFEQGILLDDLFPSLSPAVYMLDIEQDHEHKILRWVRMK